MTTTQLTMTADDLLRLPDDGLRHELVRGELTTMPLAGGQHGVIAMNVCVLLGMHVKEKQLGEVLAGGTGFLIARNPDTVRAPDVAFISKDHIPAGGLPKGFAPFAPDIAVEVLSPGDAQVDVEGKGDCPGAVCRGLSPFPQVDVEEKIEQWLKAGAAMVWVVNPRGRTVTVHRSGRDPRRLRENDLLAGEDVCPGFSVRVAELF